MVWFNPESLSLIGPDGSLHVPPDDEITLKLSMLIEGECEGLGPNQAARKYHFSKQRYFQLRTAFGEQGAIALRSQKRGPKSNYRRTHEAVRQIIRHRFLDPEASAEVMAMNVTSPMIDEIGPSSGRSTWTGRSTRPRRSFTTWRAW